MATPQQTPAYALEIRRTFAALREKVFAAWAQREQLEQGMCKDVPSHKVIHLEQDIRSGGRYRMEVRDPQKGETYMGRAYIAKCSHRRELSSPGPGPNSIPAVLPLSSIPPARKRKSPWNSSRAATPPKWS